MKPKKKIIIILFFIIINLPKSGAYCKSEFGHLSKGWVGIRSNNEIEGWKLPWIPVVEAQCGHYSVCRDWSGRLWDSNLRSVGLFSHRRNADPRQNFQPKDGEKLMTVKEGLKFACDLGFASIELAWDAQQALQSIIVGPEQQWDKSRRFFVFKEVGLVDLSVLGLLGIVIKWLIVRSTLLKRVRTGGKSL